jgi:hypothetical protein
MARQLFEEEIDLTNTSVNNTSTTTTVSRPQKFNGTAKVGTVSMGPQTLTVDEVGGRITTSDLLTQLRADIAKLKDGKGTNEIRVSGKYSEVNYVIFDIPQLNSVQSISGNVYSGVIKKQFPPETLTPTDTSTSGTSGTIGAAGTNSYPPFGEAGVVGEIREFLPTGQLYIWTFNYNIGRWIPYEAFQGGGAAPTSGGAGNDGASQLGDVGGGGYSGLGGGSGNVDPTGGPGGGRPGVLP